MKRDFSNLTTDDLLQFIPPTETTEWEFKAAAIFDPARFGEFKKQKLGKIVSSFANSGGGYLLIGKRDGETVFEPVRTHEGRTTMEDHLSLVISQSVTPHYRNFEIRRVPISGKPGDSVLVIEFLDSPAAPHQSVADVNYFYRLPGHSVPAPHFHLELLRNRSTKAVLELDEPYFALDIPVSDAGLKPMPGQKGWLMPGVELVVTTGFKLRNSSSQIANPCAVQVRNLALLDWRSDYKLLELSPTHLFPTTEVELRVTFRTTVFVGEAVEVKDGSAFAKASQVMTPVRDLNVALDDFLPLWNQLEFSLQPLTQNYAGPVRHVRPAENMGETGEAMLANAVNGWRSAYSEFVREHDAREKKMKETVNELAEHLANIKRSDLP